MEIDLQPRCDDNSLPHDPDYPLNKWYRLLTAATAKTGRPIEYNLHTKQLLESVGFVDVQDYSVQVSIFVVQDLAPWRLFHDFET